MVVAGFVLAQHREHVPVSWSGMLTRWDGFWYVYLAGHGYPRTLLIPQVNAHYGPWGFFPFWPWTIRAVHDVTRLGYAPAAGVLVTVLGVALVLAVRYYATGLYGERAGDAAVVVVSFFPGTLALSMAYTEAGFLLWAVLTLILLERRRGGLAALTTFLACATRETGATVLLAAGVAGVVAVARRRQWSMLAPVPAGLLAFGLTAWFARRRTGDARIWLKAEKSWNQVLDFGRGTYTEFTSDIPHRVADWRAYTVQLVMFAVTLVLLGLALPRLRRLPLSSWVYLLSTGFAVLAYSNVGPRPRMILALFPLLVAAAATLRGDRRRGQVAVCVYVLLAVPLTFAMSYATMYVPYHVTA